MHFLASVRPLADHGKLCAVLAQFPWGFKNTPENRDYLRVLRERMAGPGGDGGVPQPGLDGRRRGDRTCWKNWGWASAAWTNRASRAWSNPRSSLTGDTGYVRFHGRNHETWWDREARGLGAL